MRLYGILCLALAAMVGPVASAHAGSRYGVATARGGGSAHTIVGSATWYDAGGNGSDSVIWECSAVARAVKPRAVVTRIQYCNLIEVVTNRIYAGHGRATPGPLTASVNSRSGVPHVALKVCAVVDAFFADGGYSGGRHFCTT